MPDGSEHLPAAADDAAQARSLLSLMNKGLRITEPSISGAVGAAIGLLGGPPGAVLGGFVGGAFSTAVKKLASEMDKRFMGPREQARVGVVCALGAAEIVERINAGDKHEWGSCALWALPRLSNGSTQATSSERTASLRRAKQAGLTPRRSGRACCQSANETQPNAKLPYMAHMFSSLAFEELVGLDMAHQVIFDGAERLSYRQLCILKLFAVEGSLSCAVRELQRGSQRQVIVRQGSYRLHSARELRVLL